MLGKTAVFGLFRTRLAVEMAIDTLRTNGFRLSDLSVLFPQNIGTKELAHEKNTKAPEGAAGGASAGAVIGGTLGLLVGIGALAIPGLGAFIAAGPIMAALAGIGVGGVFGGIVGALVGMGVPEYEAKRYEGYIKEGGILMSIHTDDPAWTDRAKHLLAVSGARHIAAANEARADVPTEHPGHV